MNPKPPPSAGADARPSSRDSGETHPCLQIAIEQRSDEATDQKLLWLLREQLEVQKASLEAILTEHRQLSTSETAKQFELLEGQFCLQRAGLEAAAERLEVQEQKLEQLLARFIQRTSREAMVQGLQAGLQPGGDLFEGLVVKIRAESESSLQAHLRSMEELLQNHTFRTVRTLTRQVTANGTRLGMSSSKLLEETPEKEASPRDFDPTVSNSIDNGLTASSASGRIQDKDKSRVHWQANPETGHRADMRERSARDVLAAQAVMGMSYFPKPNSIKKAVEHFGGFELGLEVVTATLVALNCLWMGVEADISIQSHWAGESEPQWLSTVDFLFAIAFLLELIARLAVQGFGFFYWPAFKWNVFDLVLLIMQVVDAVTTFYNASFIRTLRVLRFFRGARIVKTINAVRHLRVLIACLYGSLSSLFWVMVLLFIVMYLCATAIMQTLPASVPVQDASTDLQDRWGSLWACMNTLFSAVSGGAPWLTLIQPLSNISKLYDLAFVVFVVFVVFGVLNIVAALFVESLANLAEVDADSEMRTHVHSKDSAVNTLRKCFLERASLGGFLSLEDMQVALESMEVVDQLKALRMDKEEAVGLFHLLDFDALGQVSVDEFVFALVKLKSKTSKAVDMATMMYENKRILLRMATFMKFVEENFKVLREILGADF